MRGEITECYCTKLCLYLEQYQNVYIHSIDHNVKSINQFNPPIFLKNKYTYGLADKVTG